MASKKQIKKAVDRLRKMLLSMDDFRSSSAVVERIVKTLKESLDLKFNKKVPSVKFNKKARASFNKKVPIVKFNKAPHNTKFNKKVPNVKFNKAHSGGFNKKIPMIKFNKARV